MYVSFTSNFYIIMKHFYVEKFVQRTTLVSLSIKYKKCEKVYGMMTKCEKKTYGQLRNGCGLNEVSPFIGIIVILNEFLFGATAILVKRNWNLSPYILLKIWNPKKIYSNS